MGDDFDHRKKDSNHDHDKYKKERPVTKAWWNGEHFQRWSCKALSLRLGSKRQRQQRLSQSHVSEPDYYNEKQANNANDHEL